MNSETRPTYTAQIYIAGQVETIERELRTWAMKGACVTLEPVRYIFKGGVEDGVRIGFINYPRFPKAQCEITAEAIALAEHLIAACGQLSASVVCSDFTTWLYLPEKQQSKLA